MSLLIGGPAAAQDVAITAGHVVPGGDAAPLEGATVLIRGGRVVAVGHGLEVEAGVPRVDLPGAWLCPGLVDAATALGALGDTDEVAQPLALGVRAGASLNAEHRDWAAARAAGVTTVLVTPGPRSPFGGAGLLVKTTGAPLDAPRVARLASGAPALRPDRPPTSRTGVAALLRARLTEAHGREGPGEDPVLDGFARGDLRGLWSVGAPSDLDLVRDLVAPFGLRVLLRLDPSFGAGDPLGDLPVVAVVLGPFDLDTPARAVRLAGDLDRAGVAVVLASDAPARAPAALRLSAALAARHGLAPARALDAITRVAADALGLAGEVGALEPGASGDLVLLDGPPLDPASRVLETWIEGRRVHHAPGRAP